MARYKTPLRYPGGKQKLAPFILELMMENGLAGGHYAEPYAGGAGIAIELLLTGNASHIHLNDSCKRIYAFWHALLTRTEELCRKISRASLTVEEWRRQKKILTTPNDVDELELGFSAFYLNRCNRSGILSGGLIGGLSQQGEWTMDVRFTLRNWDAEKFVLEYVPTLPPQSLVYLDPPYFHKAERLYLNHYQPSDHSRIAHVIQRKLKYPWVVTYDAAPEVSKCYARRRAIVYGLQYNAAKAYTGKEVAFFSTGLVLPKRSTIASIDYALRKALRSRRRRHGLAHE